MRAARTPRAPRPARRAPSNPAAATARGELALTLAGQAFVLRPSFAAISAIEAATGYSLAELAVAAGQLQLPLAQVAIVVGECIRAHGREISDPTLNVDLGRIAELIYAEPGGVLSVVRLTVQPLLQLALAGGYTAEGKAKA